MSEARLPLEGLYLHLVRAGFPISVRDYQDALAALGAGYGLDGRNDLLWLCEALWARTDQEVSRLRRLFRELPRPSPERLREWTSEPRPPDASGEANGGRAEVADREPAVRPQEPTPVVEFAAPTQSGVGLPRAQAAGATAESFILTPRPLIGLRSLVIAWRRFRVPQRCGARTELDMDATIVDQCRRGTLVEPVLLPPRRNLARMVILMDASPSMITWRLMNHLVSESLERSQLAEATLYFFDNIPSDGLSTSDALIDYLEVATVLDAHPDCALLVISDAGAVRGEFVRERLAQTRQFVTQTRASWHPLAWLNPMPPARWRGTTAERIAGLRDVAMFPLTDDSLIHAVDYLRGKRSA